MSSSELGEAENRTAQLDHFGEAFAARESVFLAMYEYLNANRAVQALQLPRHSRVLEVGPGNGFLMRRLANHGHDILGLELSPAVARHVQQRLHLRVVIESLEAHVRMVGTGAYDAIIMRHVLEHFHDPLRCLQVASTALKPGGKLYVAVPNMDSWHRHLRGWTGYEPYHVHYFCSTSLTLALRRAGFEVSGTMTCETLTGWVNTLVRTLGGRRTRSSELPARHGGWKRTVLELARLLAGVALSPMRWLQARLGRGEELTVIGVRPAG